MQFKVIINVENKYYVKTRHGIKNQSYRHIRMVNTYLKKEFYEKKDVTCLKDE